MNLDLQLSKNGKTVEGNRVAERSLLLGCMILVFSFSVVGAASITFAIGGSLSALHLIVGVLSSSLYCFWFARASRTALSLTDAGYSAIALLGLVVICAIASSFLLDTTWDGQAYHQDAIIALARGWNPFYERLTATTAKYPEWLNPYPKASWILAAALYQATRVIESAKAFNLLLVISAFLIAAPTLQFATQTRRSWVWITAVLLALNPISIGQIFSFYIDTQVASLLLALGSLCCLLAARSQYASFLLLPFLSAICLLVNVKFTALIYAGIFAFSLLVWLLATQRKAFYRIALISSVGFLIAIALCGFNPYVLNTVNHGHPFYPLAGQQKVDIISNQIPLDFASKNRVEKLVYSVFSASDDTTNATSRLKIPFTVQRKEVAAFGSGTARIGGFGVLFSGIVILVAILLVNSIEQFDQHQMKAYGWIVVTILVSVLINPEPWWARYVPQLWFLAPLSIVAANDLRSSKDSNHPRKFTQLLSYVLILVLAINCLGVAAPAWYGNLRGTWMITQQLKRFANSPGQLYVHFGNFPSNRLRFEQAGIQFTQVQAVEQLPCQPEKPFAGSDTAVCLKSR